MTGSSTHALTRSYVYESNRSAENDFEDSVYDCFWDSEVRGPLCGERKKQSLGCKPGEIRNGGGGAETDAVACGKSFELAIPHVATSASGVYKTSRTHSRILVHLSLHQTSLPHRCMFSNQLGSSHNPHRGCKHTCGDGIHHF